MLVVMTVVHYTKYLFLNMYGLTLSITFSDGLDMMMFELAQAIIKQFTNSI